MIYTFTDKVFLSGLVALFFIVVIAGVFSLSALSIWIKNRREERNEITLRAARRNEDRREVERTEWCALLQEKDNRILSLMNECSEWKRKYVMTSQLLEKSETERLKRVTL